MNDCARGQEEQCVEVGVGGEVEDSRGIVMDALAHEHIAKLTDGRIGQDAFDVKLDHCNCCGEYGGYAANDTHDSQCYGGYLKERMGTSDQVNTGSDHCGCVNERTDRRRAFHSIR